MNAGVVDPGVVIPWGVGQEVDGSGGRYMADKW